MSAELIEQIKERLGLKSVSKTSQSSCLLIDGHERLFYKSSVGHDRKIMMDGERESLEEILATNTIRAPQPKIVLHDYDQSGASSIVLEYLDISPLKDVSASNLGENLAKLHDYNKKTLRFHEKARKWIGGAPPSVKALLPRDEGETEGDEDDNPYSKHHMKISSDNRTKASSSTSTEYADKFIPHKDQSSGELFKGVHEFGFKMNTACGQVSQINEWTPEWLSFFACYRLDSPIRNLQSEHGDRELHQEWSRLQIKLEKFFVDLKQSGESIVPALLHGDLWSGNAAELLEDAQQAAVYDPSSFYGHSEYDLAIARMFGGFPEAFEKAYFEVISKKKLFEKRNKLYQLFHHLNHWIHFGSGYRSSSIRLIKELNAMV